MIAGKRIRQQEPPPLSGFRAKIKVCGHYPNCQRFDVRKNDTKGMPTYREDGVNYLAPLNVNCRAACVHETHLRRAHSSDLLEFWPHLKNWTCG